MSMIKKVLDGNWFELQAEFEQKVSDKIWSRIKEKKVDVLAKLNGTTKEKMEEIISISK